MTKEGDPVSHEYYAAKRCWESYIFIKTCPLNTCHPTRSPGVGIDESQDFYYDFKRKGCYTIENILMNSSLNAVSSREVCGSNEANGA